MRIFDLHISSKASGIKLFLLLVLISLTFIVFGQDNILYSIENKSIADGLPHIDVIDITEDNEGFIWFVTRSGLCRYDGYNIQTFLCEAEGKYNRMNSVKFNNDLLWIGTENGLLCFDIEKEKFVDIVYPDDLPKDLITNVTTCFFVDSDNQLWLKFAETGFCLAANKQVIEKAYPLNAFSDKLDQFVISSVAEDRNKNIWIGTDQGLFQLIRNTKTHYNLHKQYSRYSHDLRLIDAYITSLHFDKNNNLILGNYRAIQVVKFNEIGSSIASSIKSVDFISLPFTKIKSLSSSIENYKFSLTTSITHDQNNNLWVGTQSGLIKCKINEEYPTDADVSLILDSQYKPYCLSSSFVNKVFINQTGCLFIGTFGGGLNKLDTKQKKIQTLFKDSDQPKTSLTENTIRAIVEDDNSNLWIGTQNKGLNFFNANTKEVTSFEFPSNSIDDFNTKNDVRCLFLEKNRWLWIGGLDKVICFDTQTRKVIPLSPNFIEKTFIESGYFTGIKADAYGSLWITGWGKGIIQCIRKGDSPTDFEEINILSTSSDGFQILNNYANSICVLKNRILFGTQCGFEQIELSNAGKIQSIRHFTKDYKLENQLTNNFVWDIIPINDSMYYMATIGGGINKVTIHANTDNPEIGNYSAIPLEPYPYLTESNIECLQMDSEGNIWVVGKKLSKYNVKKEEYEPYDFSQSIFNCAFKVGSSLFGKKGTIYFGGTKGLIYFNPKEIKVNETEPKTQITQLIVHNQLVKVDSLDDKILSKSIAKTNEITLNHKQNNFMLWFSSMQFENPTHTQFRYILEGYDNHWLETTGSRPNATYLNLSFGTYCFKVYSANNDGVWSKNPRSLIIKIRPPFYRTLLAYFVYLVLLIFIIKKIIDYKSNFYRIKKDLEIEKYNEQQKEVLFQEKASFFTNLSHELRTPLTLIYSPLKDLIDHEKDNRIHTQLSFINKNVEKMLFLINKLIEFRKVESGVLKLKVNNTDINATVRAIAEQFSDWAKRKKLTYKILIPEQELIVWIDIEKIESIVYNLLTNAFKYTPDNGQIEISVFKGSADVSDANLRRTFSFGSPPSEPFSILVTDNGIGIAPNNLEKIFERYYRENMSLSEGYGIGLSLVKRLVDLHKGFVKISSALNVGSDVLVSFSCDENTYNVSEKNLTITPETHKIDFSPESIFSENYHDENFVNENTINDFSDKIITGKIILIEDDNQIRRYLKVNLSKLYTIHDFSDGVKGFEMINEMAPDLIICDIMLPSMDGIEICRRVKSNPETAHIPFVFLTAKNELADKYIGAEAGGDIYIEKPFSLAYLITEINNIMLNRKNLINKLSDNVLQHSYAIASTEKDAIFIKKLTGLVNERIGNPDFVVDDLCSELGLARSNFYAKVKQVAGKTPSDFIRDYRLEVAVKLMVKNGVSITEAAYAVGMSPTYFSKAFKHKYDKSPSDYLKEIR